LDFGEPFEEREAADEIGDGLAARFPRALVRMFKLALVRADKKSVLRASQEIQALLRVSLALPQRRLPSALL